MMYLAVPLAGNSLRKPAQQSKVHFAWLGSANPLSLL
jgi:hypothetical protein